MLDECSPNCIFIVETGWRFRLCVCEFKKRANSLAVRIPKSSLQKKKLSLKQLIAKVNKKTLHTEVDFGSPAGHEIW